MCLCTDSARNLLAIAYFELITNPEWRNTSPTMSVAVLYPSFSATARPSCTTMSNVRRGTTHHADAAVDCPKRQRTWQPYRFLTFIYTSLNELSTFAAAILGSVHSVAGTTVWNSLPDHLCDPAADPKQFKRDLKTYLFAGHSKR